MKRILNKYLALPVLALVGLTAVSCEEDYEPQYQITEDSFQLLQATGTLPVAAKYAAGETVKMELVYNKSDIKEIVLLQKIDTQDSTVVKTIPAQGAYSVRKKADTLVVEYVVPALANKATVRLDAKGVGFNNSTKTRSVSFRVAEAMPTIRIKSVSNRTATAQYGNAANDVIRYELVLNEGGVTSVTATTPATAILYKDLDSLNVYAKVGAAAETRVQRIALTKSGAALTRNVDVTVPASSAGQEVIFRFEAKSVSPKLAASVSSAPVTPSAATAFTGTSTATIGLNGDANAASFNFVARTNAGTDVIANKDITVTSVAGNKVAVKAENTTAFVKSTAAAYTSATFSSVRQAYYAGANAVPTAVVTSIADLLVGDVYIAKLVGTDNYVIFKVTAINRTETGATVTMDYKYL
ncbi:hypothetical protein TH61_06315 [Rufibacter sp. DG15C]|uniref:hypothetical protein n=1 Tax=Rufibacter sp. DG15C TaxID=1379909 RepID=UPI00078BA508|nr:hypothetical protein [Rufibacter sp. DG15C]AMM50877.1 hypothetical protein TH61_06315 [Rufibacter sp. DG15C]